MLWTLPARIICIFPILLPKIKNGESLTISRSNSTIFDITEFDIGIGLLALNILGPARGGGAWATRHTRITGISINRVVRVKPKHECFMVIPHTHDQDHSPLEGFSHVRKTSLLRVIIIVAKQRLGISTEVISEGVIGLAIDFSLEEMGRLQSLKYISIGVML